MSIFIVDGQRPLYGHVTISGCKNAALPILFSCIATGGTSYIHNIPDIGDIRVTLCVLEAMGAKIRKTGDLTEINTDGISCEGIPEILCGGIRASSYLIGACLARFGEVRVPSVGGCNFGERPLDMHIGAAISLGADYDGETLRAKKLTCGEIYFPIPSVGATVNAVIMASLAHGESVIHGAAREPHIVNLCDFLRSCGADISGDGGDTIYIRGADALVGGRVRVIPDMIEAGTFATAVMSAGGSIILDGIRSDDLGPLYALFPHLGADISEDDGSTVVSSDGTVRSASILASPYPGIPTDMHPQLAAVLGVGEGRSVICDSVWKNRFRYIDELAKMGYNIRRVGNTAFIDGVKDIRPAKVRATDLRAGAALIVASLRVRGVCEIHDSEVIERGYDGIADKLSSLGACINKVIK